MPDHAASAFSLIYEGGDTNHHNPAQQHDHQHTHPASAFLVPVVLLFLYEDWIDVSFEQAHVLPLNCMGMG
jgi:hypothetical protein